MGSLDAKRVRQQPFSAKHRHSRPPRFPPFAVHAREGDVLVSFADTALPKHPHGFILEDSQFGIRRVAAVEQVLVRERLALVVADADDEPFAAWAGPQKAVAVVARGLRSVAFNGG